MKRSYSRAMIFIIGSWLLSCTAHRKMDTTVKKDGRPNNIVILADDLGYSDIGCYGGQIETANIDYLAANGMRFNRFYNTVRCCPTWASL